MYLVAILLVKTGLAQDGKIDLVLKEQIEAFNQHDTKRLVANVSDDFIWFSVFPDSMTVETRGKVEFEKAMIGYFKAVPTVSTSLGELLIEGNKISFKETASWQGKEGKLSQSSLATYEIKNGLITRVWYFYD
tara:strand:+ start:3307 stop:3705 length:399 start_codon:yes stop_codon:yes gene_type:complete